ncbi:hypothetical protein CEXT_492831 [Caerostris extrusa]|uniref:Uncharacterized protein n=1 Tax=Caerostris extrusa TaxID=172846 RepID=A0AAV4RYQ3_CAEEX|nr:hypothetical protein CEXT_492831 [Caerostris extrusa]
MGDAYKCACALELRPRANLFVPRRLLFESPRPDIGLLLSISDPLSPRYGWEGVRSRDFLMAVAPFFSCLITAIVLPTLYPRERSNYHAKDELK